MNVDASGTKGMLEAQYFAPAAPGTLGGSDLAACFNRYHQTKLANSVFAQALHAKLQQRGPYSILAAGATLGTGRGRCMVKSLCAEPGVWTSGIGRKSPLATEILLEVTDGLRRPP